MWSAVTVAVAVVAPVEAGEAGDDEEARGAVAALLVYQHPQTDDDDQGEDDAEDDSNQGSRGPSETKNQFAMCDSNDC